VNVFNCFYAVFQGGFKEIKLFWKWLIMCASRLNSASGSFCTSIDPGHFMNPPAEYRPVVFWSWNEVMDPGEIRRQLDEMVKAGLGGGFVHSRIGLLTDYLGEEWFEAVDAVIDECSKLGLKVYLYDEDKWPSGFAGGKVPLAKGSYRMKVLFARDPGQRLPEGSQAFGEPINGLQVYRLEMPLGFEWFNGTTYGDLLSKEAMSFFIKCSYQSYFQKYSQHYGNEIVYQFTDEPCSIFRMIVPFGSVPYTDEMDGRFFEMHGYELKGSVHKLFMGGVDSERFRLHYFRTVNDLFENNFSKQIGDWCQEHNIGLTGHYMLEGSLYGQQDWGVKVMPNYRHQKAPGIDHLGLQIDEVISAKQCQSVVNQFGKERMLSEMFGCSGQDMRFSDRLWIASQQIQLGVNLINPHLSLYTMSGCRKRDYPPNLFYQQPWWGVNDNLDIPLSRLCYAMSKGVYSADILLLHPQESIFCLWQVGHSDCESESELNVKGVNYDLIAKEGFEEINRIESSLDGLIRRLLDSQLHFDFGDETIMAQNAEVVQVDGEAKIKIGAMEYKTVVVPDCYTLSEETIELLSEFAAAGGKVLVSDGAPEKVDATDSDEFKELCDRYDGVVKCSEGELVGELKKVAFVEFEADEGDEGLVWTHPRQLDDGCMSLLVTNLNRDKGVSGRLKVFGEYVSASVYDHFNGCCESVEVSRVDGALCLDIWLAPVQSRLLVFDKDVGCNEGGVKLTRNEAAAVVDIASESVEVNVLDENAFVLDHCYFAKGDEGYSYRKMPVIAIQEMLNNTRYSGGLKLRYTFEAAVFDKSNKAAVVIEHPEYYRIKVNNKDVESREEDYYRDIRFMKIDITGLIDEGSNEIVLECDDFQFGDKKNVDNYFARYGTEIESIYIIGDFSVKGATVKGKADMTHWEHIGVDPGICFFSDEGLVLTDPVKPIFNNFTKNGYPFYAGRLSYAVDLPEVGAQEGDKYYLKLERLKAPCAEVFIDGVSVGFIYTEPFEVNITERYKPGAKVEIVLYSSLRNLLGPHHNTQGEIAWVGPDNFLPGNDKIDDYEGFFNDWLEQKDYP
jgi:hypothetical protein